MHWEGWLASLSSLVCGGALYLMQRALNKRDRQQAQREKEQERRREERLAQERRAVLLQLKMIDAGNALSHACAMALKRGRANGEVEAAEKMYADCRKAYADFMQQAAVEHPPVYRINGKVFRQNRGGRVGERMCNGYSLPNNAAEAISASLCRCKHAFRYWQQSPIVFPDAPQ